MLKHKHILWIDEFLNHFATIKDHCLLVFTGESSSQGSLGGAGFRPSTVLFVEYTQQKQWLTFNHMAVGQNQWCHFGVVAPPILVCCSGWIGMFTWGTIWILTHLLKASSEPRTPRIFKSLVQNSDRHFEERDGWLPTRKVAFGGERSVRLCFQVLKYLHIYIYIFEFPLLVFQEIYHDWK